MSEEAAANGYGTISYINALQLSVSFGLVALFAVRLLCINMYYKNDHMLFFWCSVGVF